MTSSTVRPVALMALAAAILVRSGSIAAQAPAVPAFRFERPIRSDGEGPRRLAVDVTLLAGAAPFRVVRTAVEPVTGRQIMSASDGLRDLRLYDASGRDVGYLLVRNPPDAPQYRSAGLLPVAAVENNRERTSGFEADLGEPLLVDAFRLASMTPPFLKRVRLEGSGDREHWTLLVSEGTVFDLPDEQLRQTELRFTAGSYRYLRLTWDDSKSGRVPQPPSAAARRVSSNAPPPPLTAPLTFERRPSEPSRSRFRVHLPGGHLPIVALDLDVAPGYVLRDAAVYEARLSSGGVFRFDVLDPERTDRTQRCRVRVYEGAASTPGASLTYVLRDGQQMIMNRRAGDMIPVNPLDVSILDQLDRWAREQIR